MGNPFEQAPVLPKPAAAEQKNKNVCEHGNQGGLCEVCGDARKKKEKIDYFNPENLRNILLHPDKSINLKQCTRFEFAKTVFGKNTRYKEISGQSLLLNFGSKKADIQNMVALLQFAEIDREIIDYSNPEHLREILSDSEPKIDLEKCSLHVFRKVTFGKNTRFSNIKGVTLLTNFGSKQESVENLIAMINLAGMKRENFNILNLEHLKEVLDDPEKEIDLQLCRFTEFARNYFGTNTRFGKMMGKRLLANFGNREENTDNMAALINFAGFKREHETKVGIGDAPIGWKFNNELAKEIIEELGLKNDADKFLLRNVAKFTKRIADKLKGGNLESFKICKSNIGGRSKMEYYAPEICEEIKRQYKIFHQIERAENDWKTAGALRKELGVDHETIVRIVKEIISEGVVSVDENIKLKKDQVSRPANHYSPILCMMVKERIGNRPPEAPENWKTLNFIANALGVPVSLVEKSSNEYRKSNPEYFKLYLDSTKKESEHYSPELCNLIKESEEIKLYKSYEIAPTDWKTAYAIAAENNVSPPSVELMIKKFGNDDTSKMMISSKTNVLRLHCSPELVETITKELKIRKAEEEQEKQEENLKQSLEYFVREVSNSESVDERARKIREIISYLPENACDIIFKYHPEYNGLDMGYVRSVIAEYLGDFLSVRKPWETKDIEVAKELFSDDKFAEALFLKFKDASFAYFQKEKKNNPEMSEYDLIMRYFADPDLLEAAGRIPEVGKTMERLKAYYEDVFKWAEKKPDGIADNLKEGRVFPDINQLINIKEITDNKKMLIADEMGLGKSASAVLAKEYMGLKCGLIVAPSNVISTWEKYLSSAKDENGKQAGYFKSGFEPKVLTLENPEDIAKLGQPYDYILISQEKLNDRYVEVLGQTDYDMLIVDEVHKLKNIEQGVRSENIVKLSEKIQGQEKYLAMLSGTPAPNKVKDLAIVLKLLYPEKYRDYDDKELVNRIIYGDLVDLREELFSRMQMKELAASIEMPPLLEEDVEIELAEAEKEVYQILLEEDELTATEKIIVFRQFLLNPQLLSVEPGFEGSKVMKLKETLFEDLKTKNKIVVFVNGYIEGVIRGENNIVDKIRQELPADVAIKTIHGEIKNDQERKKIETELKISAGKMVVFVSGQTADVGVDFSGADEVIFYNEPWSRYEKRQQQGRSYREGLKGPLNAKTLLARGTIEEGIRRYTLAKERAIEKLLRGIDRTRAENILLEKDSRSSRNDVETNSELSRDYMNDWEKLMLHFGEGWEAGDEWFRNLPEEKKDSYAGLYRKLGGLTYQGNNARVSASLIMSMIGEKREIAPEKARILDVASGPEMLKRHAPKELDGRIYSLDINDSHFREALDRRRTFKSSYLDLPVKSDSVDYYNIGFAFHQTKPVKFYKKNYERLQVLAEMNRILKVGGRGVISEVHNVEFVNPEKFEELAGQLGFRIVKEYSGTAEGGGNYRAHFLTLEKIAEIPEYDGEIRFNDPDKSRRVKELGGKLDRELLSGLEIRKLSKGASRLKDQRRMVEKIKIGNREVGVVFNEADEKLFAEEQATIRAGEELKQKYGGIENIPLSEIKEAGFERRLHTPGYYLLYKIIENGGAVVIRSES